jgi:peroxiredoxin
MTNADLPPEIEQRPQSRREWSGWLRSLVLPLALVVIIVGGLLYYDARRSDSVSDTPYGSVALPDAKNATGRAPAGEADHAAPDFLLETLDGDELRLSDVHGRPLLVNFWATWCTTCRLEMPDLIEAYETHKSTGFLILGVNQREADTRVQRFVDEFDIGFPVVMDRRGEVARTWRIGGPTQGLPSSYFIDAQGVIRKVVFGTVRAKDLEEGLALIMGAGE